jgi:peptidoglycan/LPS O-acetylase OafA/YrhL
MPHKPQLDGLRFVAFLLVFYFHAKPGLYSWGPEGVRIFFTLSGFLITRILIEGESGDLRADLKRFYIRRTLRIFPLYYAVVACLWATGQLPGVGWYLTYLYNIRAWRDHTWGGPVGHFWSLCVEEQFYVLYPLALLLTPARFRFAMLGALLAGSKVFQGYAHARLVMPWSGFLLPYCGESLIWGCLAGLVELRTRPGKWEGPLAFLAGVPLLWLAKVPAVWTNSPEFADRMLVCLSGFGIGSALVVFGLWRTSRPWIVWPLAIRPVAYLGRISYGLYVYHLLVIEQDWLHYLPESYLFRFRNSLGELALTIAISAASWRFFEGPINRLKDRLTGPSPRLTVSVMESPTPTPTRG